MNELDIIERYPAFNIRKIVDKIFEGYHIEDNLPGWFDDLYLLYTGTHQLRNSEDWLSTYTEEKSMNAQGQDSDTETGAEGTFSLSIDPILVFDGGGTYFVPEKGTYRFLFTFPVVQINAIVQSGETGVSGSVVMTSTLKITVKSNTRGDITTLTQTVNETMGSTPINYERALDTRYFECAHDEQISIDVEWSGDYSITSPPADPGVALTLIVDDEDSTATIVPNRWYGVGSTVQISELMPDMDVLDFLQGLFNYLSISVYHDVINNRVILWHYRPAKIIDWTKRAMLETVQTRRAEPHRWVYPFVEDDFDYDGEDFEHGTGKPRQVDIMVSNVSAYIGSLIVLRKGETDPETFKTPWATEGNVRIVRFTGATSKSYRMHHTRFGEDNQFTDRTTIPNLHVMEMGSYTRPGFVEQGVFTYHRSMIDSENKGQEMECELVLSSKDVLSLAYMKDGEDWREAYHIDGKNYRLIEIEQLEGNIYRGRFKQIFL